MLNALRKKKVAKRILWVLAILIIPAFVFWGVGNLGSKRIKGFSYVGLINGRKISIDDFFKAKRGVEIELLLNYFIQREVLDKILKDREFVNKLTWNRIIMFGEVKRSNIKIKDKEVVTFITSHPLFVNNGVFDEKFYNYFLRQHLGINARTFEEEIRQSLRIAKLKDDVLEAVSVTDEEMLETYRKEFEEGRISYIRIEKDRFEDAEAAASDMLSLIQKKNFSLEDVSSRFNLKVDKTDLISRFDYVEGVGEAYDILDSLFTSRDVKQFKTRKGYIITRLDEFKEIDIEQFNKEKEDYRNKVLAIKKTKALQNWLAGISKDTHLNIDLSLL